MIANGVKLRRKSGDDAARARVIRETTLFSATTIER
jgi:hypothetical protein